VKKEITALREEIVKIRELVQDLKSKRGEESILITGVAVKSSEIMNGFQSAMSKAIKSQSASSEGNGENIKNFIIKDLEVEFAAPIVAERGGEEPILIIPNIKSVSTDSPLVRLKFTITNVPPKE
jgi:hypothetical protein